jgi:hypothetical protein
VVGVSDDKKNPGSDILVQNNEMNINQSNMDDSTSKRGRKIITPL